MKLKLGLLMTVLMMDYAKAQVLPPDAIVGGKTQGEWSAAWWQWVLPLSPDHHPLFDKTGESAHVGQSGPVFFLAGVFEAGNFVSANRSILLPEGKHLFVPLLNYAVDNLNTVPPMSVEELRQLLDGVVSSIGDLYATIDGVPVPNLFDHRAMSPVFSLELTNPDNLVAFLGGEPFVGQIDPVVADGYYLMIQPLPPGVHVINFGGAVPAPNNFTLDITYTITVVPVPLADRIEDLTLKLADSGLASNRVHALVVSLNSALASFDANNPIAGVNQLGAFQNKVCAQVGRANPSLAAELVKAAQDIIDRANHP